LTNRKACREGALQTAAVNPNESMLAIDGIHCAACAPTIEAALRAVPGVVEAEVNGATQRARVRWTQGRAQVDPSAEHASDQLLLGLLKMQE